jgi:hypothetical protein
MGEAIFKTRLLHSRGKGPQIPVRHKNWSPLFEEKHLFSPTGNLTKIPRRKKKNKEKDVQVNGRGLILDTLAVHKKHWLYTHHLSQ